jgi:hypothetical protein
MGILSENVHLNDREGDERQDWGKTLVMSYENGTSSDIAHWRGLVIMMLYLRVLLPKC